VDGIFSLASPEKCGADLTFGGDANVSAASQSSGKASSLRGALQLRRTHGHVRVPHARPTCASHMRVPHARPLLRYGSQPIPAARPRRGKPASQQSGSWLSRRGPDEAGIAPHYQSNHKVSALANRITIKQLIEKNVLWALVLCYVYLCCKNAVAHRNRCQHGRVRGPEGCSQSVFHWGTLAICGG